jgi:hypothetical protein
VPGYAHGGSVAAALDEAMGGAAWWAGHQSVAARLAVDSDVAVSRIVATGEHPLERMASLCAIGDYASVYLGILRGVDPTPIHPIQILKDRLAGATVAKGGS